MILGGASATTIATATPSTAEGFTSGLEAATGDDAAPVHDHSDHVHDTSGAGVPSVPKELPEELPGVPGIGPALTASGPPQPTYLANRTQYVVLLNGYLASTEGSKNVNGEYQQIIDALKSWGWQDSKIGGVAVYACDENYTWNSGNQGKPGVSDIHALELGDRDQAGNHQGQSNCGSLVFPKAPTTPHTSETTIQHLAYHWAWTIRNQIGSQCVNAVGHSMGALVIRYALQRIEAGDTDFPLDLCVDDVISLGGSHSGSNNAGIWCPDWQCAQQIPGSSFLNSLTNRHPDTAGGTDWTNMGSTGDSSTPPPGSVNANMDPDHAITYEEDIKHTSNFGASLYWKNATSSALTANIRWTDVALGFEATTQEGPWPIRHADMSMAYNHWGCGVGNVNSAFPLKNGVETVGEPYHADFDCWYYIDVPAGSQAKVTMSSLNNEDLDLYLYNSLEAMPVCQSISTGPTETCASTSSGRWWARVGNAADTRNPFTIQATVQNDCGTGLEAGNTHATATAITTPKSNCSGQLVPPIDTQDWYQFPVTAGQQVNLSVTPPAGSDFDLCLHDPAGNAVACSQLGGSATDSVSHTAGTTGNYRARVYRFTGSGSYTFSASVVTPQNDCGTGVDAGNTHAAATSLSVPQSGCSGALLTGEGDTTDYYKFPVTTGTTINTSLSNNASSNFDLCIYNPSGTLVAGCTAGSVGGTDTLSHTATATGDYRVRVRLTSGTGSYTMSVSTTAPQNDCGTGGDAPGTHASAAAISLPKSNCTGTLIEGSDHEDFYKFSVTSGHTISASMTNNASSDYDICLYDPAGNLIGSCTIGTVGGTDTLTHTATTTGDYRLRVTRWSGTGNYTMSVSASAPPQNDCDTGADAGNTFATAAAISLPKSNCTGTLVSGSDHDDYYKFGVTAGQTITATLVNNASSDYDICLYNPSGGLVGSCTVGTVGGTDTITQTATATGDYRLQVTRWSGTGNYTLSVSTSGGSVTIRKDDNERDTSSSFNYNDDTALKRLDITSGQLAGKTTATLWILAQADACSGAPSAAKYKLRANNNSVVDFNPCNEWSTSSHTWKSFNVPISHLTAGTATFHIEHLSGDWSTRNMFLAVDSDTVPDTSDIAFDNNNVNGELMWYLVLS